METTDDDRETETATRQSRPSLRCVSGVALAVLSQASCGASPDDGAADVHPHVQTQTSELVGASPVVVSITFDDTVADQYAARAILKAHGMRWTFYVNSPRIGKSGYMTQQQIQDLLNDGNEIGSHTLTHPHLPTLSTADQTRELCDDRVTLTSLFSPANPGFSVRSVAYPFGESNTTTLDVMTACGFSSGRGVGGLCGTCSSNAAEPIPPANAKLVRGYGSIKSTMSVGTITGWITNATNNGGGWVPLVVHHVCEGCNTYGMTAANLDAVLTWAPTSS